MAKFPHRFLLLMLLFCGWGLISVPDAAAFRCGDSVISIGDSKSRVLIECGQPTHKEKVGSKEVSTNGQGTKYRRKKSSRGVEQWTYNCGAHDFIYILTFEGGKLTKEETNGRGKGKSRCQGNQD